MEDARYLRARAEHFRRLATLIGDVRTVETLKAHAAECLAGAEQMETEQAAPDRESPRLET